MQIIERNCLNKIRMIYWLEIKKYFLHITYQQNSFKASYTFLDLKKLIWFFFTNITSSHQILYLKYWHITTNWMNRQWHVNLRPRKWSERVEFTIDKARLSYCKLQNFEFIFKLFQNFKRVFQDGGHDNCHTDHIILK